MKETGILEAGGSQSVCWGTSSAPHCDEVAGCNVKYFWKGQKSACLGKINSPKSATSYPPFSKKQGSHIFPSLSLKAHLHEVLVATSQC